MKINVTQDDIAKGVPEEDASCPIAHAARRAFPGAQHISVTEHDIYVVPDWGDRSTQTFYPLPTEAKQFVKTFDNGLPVEPFDFEAEPEL